MTIPSSILMWVLALPIVQIVYQSGHFSYNDALLAADILRWFSVGIFAWSAHSIITRGFFALQESRVPIIVGTFVTLIFIPMNLPLKNLMHASGLALATSIAATIHMVVLLALLHIRLKGLEDARLAISIAKTCVASLIAAIACSLLYRPLFHHFLENADHGARAKAGFVLLICLVVSGLIYIAAAIAMRMEEVKILHRLVQRLRPKSA